MNQLLDKITSWFSRVVCLEIIGANNGSLIAISLVGRDSYKYMCRRCGTIINPDHNYPIYPIHVRFAREIR